ncbi:glycoside hydrolase family 97 protein [Pseudoxanthomonas wuyuanensis]|uniref:Alpha-glucosidase n=1 Tax=Pseudoxanthomonas wuyuanensis TaxID=1073196 RepID=A0A286DD01_9GAMM|nr:glycoside hydrolase family 97 protein [Pseudoxanthomonas wuyuanensis]KAF1720739.1 alpha-glucosidase [Pseudoxanthomonas wuyuanensis]SOD56531.1 alpha-glucosidase [Pseudoxanthomonas wuyuanensis]
MPNRLFALTALLLLSITVSTSVSAPASAAPTPPAPAVFSIASPDGRLTASITTDHEGRPSYRVDRNGAPVISSSRLGLILLDAPKFERNLAVSNPRTRSFDQRWEQPWGERRYIRNHYNELRVTLTERTRPFRSFDVVFRVYDDGLGFRYEFPDQAALKQLRIAEELTEFDIAGDATAWWIPAGEWNREEYLYNRTPLQEVGDAQTPITLRRQDGLHVTIHEAALVDYSGMNLTRVEAHRLKANLTPGIGDGKVVRNAPFHTPWRTLQISDNAAGLAMSSLILNLNEPNALGDVSWVKPMKYVGVWWEMHLDKKSWASGAKHGATNENVRRHIDFAAAHGFGGVLVEGWNVGWDGDWFGNGEDFSFTESYPDFDLDALTAYANAKGVQLIGHHETSGHAAHYESQLDAAFNLYQRVGIRAVKTGYVADAGQAKVIGSDGKLHYAWHEGQDMARHHLKVVTEAAKRHISVNPHEPVKDSGLRRTYPNWITREGARGMEFSAWGNPGNPPEHETNLVFTRLLAGPMDYTPGIFGTRTRPGSQVATTWAKQLALYVVIYSPLQMAADLLDNYEANPAPFQFIKDVPVDWDQTVVLNGEVGDYVTIARKDRHSDNWYLGAVSDDQARSLPVALSFLQAGRRYTAQIYRDGERADWKTTPEDIVIEEREVSSSDTLTLRLAAGGGQAIRFIAQ